MLLFAIYIALLSIASVMDLQKAEVSDKLSYGMIAIGIISAAVSSAIQNNHLLMLESIFWGFVFFLFGYILFRMNAWGGADAKILAGLGTGLGAIFPVYGFAPWPVQLTFFFNMLFCGVAGYFAVFAYRAARKESLPWILSEIRFVPAFLLALLVTAFYGDVLYSFISLIIA